jgi:2-polyprenyl-3-methyl-5-hydroxy-6-metoxy-1,4-benzoquinol methylase
MCLLARIDLTDVLTPGVVAQNGHHAPPDRQPRACPHPSDRLTPLFPARDYISNDLFEVARCGVCGLAVTVPQPLGAAMNAYYPPGYYGSQQGKRFPGMVERLQDALYVWRARRLEALNGGQPGRVLDVGCGRGLLLEQLRRRGWEVQGTELSAQSAAYPRDVLGIPVHIGDLADLHFPSDHFDAVVMWHVLEHVPDPAVVLAEVTRILRPGGVFLVAVPNFGSLEARLTRDKWFHLDVPRHLNHYTPAVLYRALAGVGLRVCQAAYFTPEYDFFSFVQSILNWIGLRPNLLYNLLRGRGAKVMQERGGVGPAQIVATLLLGLPLSLLSLPESLAAAALHQGGTLTLYTQKTDSRPTAHG